MHNIFFMNVNVQLRDMFKSQDYAWNKTKIFDWE